MKLNEQKCQPCLSGTPALSADEAKTMLSEITGWTLKDKSIDREFTFRDFRESIAFVNKVADIAEQQNHHPDIHIYYNKVRVELSTHKIAGLSRNDFILAAKIDDLSKNRK